MSRGYKSRKGRTAAQVAAARAMAAATWNGITHVTYPASFEAEARKLDGASLRHYGYAWPWRGERVRCFQRTDGRRFYVGCAQ